MRIEQFNKAQEWVAERRGEVVVVSLVAGLLFAGGGAWLGRKLDQRRWQIGGALVGGSVAVVGVAGAAFARGLPQQSPPNGVTKARHGPELMRAAVEANAGSLDVAVYWLLRWAEPVNSCEERLQWGNVWVRDAKHLVLDGQVIYSYDAWSTQESGLKPVSLRKKILALSAHQHAKLIELLPTDREPEDAELFDIVLEIRTMAGVLRHRYLRVTEHFEDFFERQLGKIVRDWEYGAEELSDYENMCRLCRTVIVDILRGARIEGHCLLLNNASIVLEFGRLGPSQAVGQEFALHRVNPLTSRSYAEDTVVDMQALEAARLLRGLRVGDFIRLKLCLAEGRPLEVEERLQTLINQLGSLVLRHDFTWVAATLSSSSESPALQREEEGIVWVRQDQCKLEEALEKMGYKVQGTGAVVGDCLLAAVLNQVGYAEGGTWKLRERIATHIRLNKVIFRPYVKLDDEGEDQFDGLETWARARSLDDIDGAIERRCQDYMAGRVWTMEPEYMAISRIYKRPVHMFINDYTKYKTRDGMPIPHDIYGADLQGDPIRLFYSHQHTYSLVKQRGLLR